MFMRAIMAVVVDSFQSRPPAGFPLAQADPTDKQTSLDGRLRRCVALNSFQQKGRHMTGLLIYSMEVQQSED
jgi:hypothetical protein